MTVPVCPWAARPIATVRPRVEKGGSIEKSQIGGSVPQARERRADARPPRAADELSGKAAARSVARLRHRKGLQVDSELPIRSCHSRRWLSGSRLPAFYARDGRPGGARADPMSW
jgi:hypothetical protein